MFASGHVYNFPDFIMNSVRRKKSGKKLFVGGNEVKKSPELYVNKHGKFSVNLRH